MRAKWVLAKLRAHGMPQRYGVMLPWDMQQLRHTEAQFTARTLHEARFL